MRFYCGVHHPAKAHLFDNAFVSINAIKNRRSDFKVANWILDSGAFSQVSQYGEFQMTTEEYAYRIARWHQCGNLQKAVAQDYMCEPWILEKTGGTVEKHQQWTIDRYIALRSIAGDIIMPCLQGQIVGDYVKHLEMYGDIIQHNEWVGVGSVCKRKNESGIEEIMEAIKDIRPDLRLHGFGLKITALVSAKVRDLLESADSMAWSFNARYAHGNANDYNHAIRFVQRIESMALQESFKW